MLRGLFTRRPAESRPDPEPVKRMVRAVLADLAPGMNDVELTVSEIDCLDPACVGLETVILLMQPGRATRAVKVAGPISDITEQEIRSCLVAAGFGNCP